MQLNRTRFKNGMAFLEPTTVTLLGGESDELEQRQLHEFQQSLRSRRGYALCRILFYFAVQLTNRLIPVCHSCLNRPYHKIL